MNRNRYTPLEGSLPPQLFQHLSSVRVLMVGAGGIGCELLKNLVLSGFKHIEIIDLDTIDLSNLNRQFLFHHQHIGQSKAVIAKQSIKRFDATVDITAHHGNVLDPKFGADFISSFDLVLNALDNLTARRHVNRLCVACGVPLIESGTSGYLGQVQVIYSPETECYECQPKPTPKTYAYCTIRSNPKEPVHCVIWAKEEFRAAFGGEESAVDESDSVSSDSQILQVNKELAAKLQTDGFAKWLFFKLFYFTIYVKTRTAEITGESFWEDRAPPKPLKLEMGLEEKSLQYVSAPVRDQEVWDIPTCCKKFLESAHALAKRAEKGPIKFDKDDADAVQFVTAASNLRSFIFGIPLQSYFSVKSLAGNIIPAIATTNAVIAGLIVIEAFKVLQQFLTKKSLPKNVRSIYLAKNPSGGRLLLATPPDLPNPKCYVCSSKNITLKLDCNTITLEILVEKILKQTLGFNEPTLVISSDLLYEAGEGLEPEEIQIYQKKLPKKLVELGIVHNSLLDLDDLSQELKLKVTISQKDIFQNNEIFEIVGEIPKSEELKASKMEAEDDAPESEGECEILEVRTSESMPKRPASEEPANLKKKKEDDQIIEL